MAELSPGEIAGRVSRQQTATSELRERMERDYDRYRLVPHVTEAGYKVYTSNQARTYADKVISWLVEAIVLPRVPHMGKNQADRNRDSFKERWVIGLLKSADDRLARLVLPPLQEQLSFYVSIRGWLAGRAVLTRRAEENGGGSFVDITPWDPMYTFWERNDEGLEWACYKMLKTAAEIKLAYGQEVANSSPEDLITVYDYYDNEINTVTTEGDVLKQPTPHGSPRVPVFLDASGLTPPMFREQEFLCSEYGESIFAANREVYDGMNEILSIWMQLVSQARKPPTAVRSRDGTKTLEDEPWLEGSVVSLAEGEDIDQLRLQQMTPDAGALAAIISGDSQRGSVSNIVYGESPFQLSGFAMQTLRQGIGTVLTPRIKSMIRAYKQIEGLLTDQYLEGGHDAMTLSGRDRNRKYFSGTIKPSDIKAAGDVEIQIISVLPQDDQTKMGMAQIAREGPIPLLPDQYIWDEILGIQDTDQLSNEIKEQMGERALPEAGLLTLMEALDDRGREQLADMYRAKLMTMFAQNMQQMQAGAVPPGANGTNGTNGTVPPPNAAGINPAVVPGASLGVPPPTPQPTAATSAGAPRPAILSEEERLRRLGLLPASGEEA